jgi:pyruvate/2-oxoglutarate dehydrogenase complex dihydrolipoamide dehydrogenase (E3) component
LGGTLNIASIVPGKEKFKWIIEYYAYELPRLGVRTHLGCTVNRKKVEESRPDIVIVATGAEPAAPNVTGVNNSNAVFAHDVLGGKVKIENSKVTIIGGGLIGLETAEFLASKDNDVTIVKRYETISRDIEPLYASYLLSKLKKLRVKIMFKVKVKEVRFNCVIIESDEGRIISIPSDWVVIARGLSPSNRIVHELEGYEVYLIGDCLKPRRIYNAIVEGFMVARRI